MRMSVTIMKKELMIRVLQELGELLCQTQGYRVGHDEGVGDEVQRGEKKKKQRVKREV